jgi:ribonuclease P protein component
MQPVFRDLFSFSPAEVKEAFAVAVALGYGQGVKLIKAPSRHPYSKLLVITPRASGRAHDRNLLRRRAKAIFYEHASHQNPATFILLTNKKATTASFQILKTFLLKHICSL